MSTLLDKGHVLTHAKMALRDAGRAGRDTRAAQRAVNAAHSAYTDAWSALSIDERKRYGMIPWRECATCS